MKFLFFAGGATVTGMEVALLSLMARLNAIGHRAVAIVSGWHDGAYLPMLDAAGIEHHEVFLGRIYRNNPNWTRGTLWALGDAARDIRRIAASLEPDWVVFGEAQSLLFCTLVLPGARRLLYLHGEPERIMHHPIGGRVIGGSVRRIVCVSDFLADKVRGTPLRRKPLAIVHNGTLLPVVERAALAEALLSSLDRPDPQIDALWAREAEDRLIAFEAGEMEAIPAEDVFTELERP